MLVHGHAATSAATMFSCCNFAPQSSTAAVFSSSCPQQTGASPVPWHPARIWSERAHRNGGWWNHLWCCQAGQGDPSCGS